VPCKLVATPSENSPTLTQDGPPTTGGIALGNVGRRLDGVDKKREGRRLMSRNKGEKA
jgi:hypothetical protein